MTGVQTCALPISCIIGQTYFTVMKMNAKNTIAWANSVALMFMASPSGSALGLRFLAEWAGQRIREREEHRDTEANDERRVDQPEQQEHLALQ